MRRRLNEATLFGRVARIEYPFTSQHIAERLKFAQSHLAWDEDRWGRVLFADETYITLGADRQIWVQRPDDAAYLPQYMVTGQVNFVPKIGVWACFSRQGVGLLRIFDFEMNNVFYTDTMKKK